MIKFTTEPQTLLVRTAGNRHFSSASIAYREMNPIFPMYFFELFMNFNTGYLKKNAAEHYLAHGSKNWSYLMPF